MKIALATLLIGSAAAFAPAAKKAGTSSASSALNSYENELGVIEPTGFFDPLGLSKDIDQETFDKYRTCELKHGRVCMLAVVGYVVQEIYRWPGEIAPGLAFADIPNGVAAVDAIPSLGWAQMFFAIGATDYYGFLGNFDVGKKQGTGYELNELQVRNIYWQQQHYQHSPVWCGVVWCVVKGPKLCTPHITQLTYAYYPRSSLEL